MISPILILAGSEPTINNPIIPINQIILNLKQNILNVVWTIAEAFVIMMFVMAGFKYLTAEGKPDKIDEANKAVMWGLFGTAVIVLAWSIVWIIRFTIGI